MLRAILFPILQGARCLQKLATGKYPAPMSLFIRIIDAFRARNIRNNNNTKMILREVKRSCLKISVSDYRIKKLLSENILNFKIVFYVKHKNVAHYQSLSIVLSLSLSLSL